MPTPRTMRRAAAAAALALALPLAACSSSDPLGEGSSSDGDSDAIVVGSQAYYSNEIIAEIYAQALEDAGYTVDRQFQIGQRDVYIPELESGSIDVMPEYTGNLLQFYDAEATASTPEEVSAALGEALPDGLRVLTSAEASDQDSYTTTQEFADEHQLESIADLANVDEPLSIAANAEFAERPYGPDGVLAAYGVTISVTTVQDSGGPLTLQALTNGDAQLADLYTSDPAIETEDLVVLDDPENLILPQNVVPLVTDAVDDDAAAVLDAVNAKLSADELVSLNVSSTVDQESSAAIATAWLTDQGLIG